MTQPIISTETKFLLIFQIFKDFFKERGSLQRYLLLLCPLFFDSSIVCVKSLVITASSKNLVNRLEISDSVIIKNPLPSQK